ncbi:MAG: hypothetical protein WD906_02940 [Anaerolineales bacterium]
MSMPRTGIVLLSALLLAACAAGSTPAASTTLNRAGLVVLHADGSTRTACVEFEGSTLPGEELLSRSGMAVSLDSRNAMGSLVCSIDQEGCAFPSEPCLCGCGTPGACMYWAYFHRDGGAAWVYSALGAQMRQVAAGELDAWVWLSSSGTADSDAVLERLEIFTFEGVCPVP